MSAVLQSALEFAGRGYNVFPTNQKRPVLENWPKLSTNNPSQIENWFTNSFKWVDGFGVCPKKTCVVIDVDVKDGKDGINSLKYLIENFGLSKDTLIVKTKSGGLHLYYKYPQLHDEFYIKSIANWSLLNGHLLDGIDIRGDKGQVIGPVPGNGYEIIADKPLADLPEKLIEHLPIDSSGGLKLDAHSAQSLIDEHATKGLKGLIPDVIEQGQRHEVLLSLTASWARKFPYETAKILLREAINRCEGDDITYEDYIERLDDAYAKFKPVIEDKLQWMIDNLVFVAQGSRVYRSDKPANSATIDISEARALYKNWTIFDETEDAQGKPKIKASNSFDRWMQNPDRHTVENIGYKPTDEKVYVDNMSGVEVINTYRSPELDVLPSVNNDDVKPFIDLVEFLWEENAETMFNVCAHLVQRPTFKMHWAPLLITPAEGMGKNLFFSCLARCIGRWNAGTVNASQFNKSFNTFLVENLVTVISEVQEISKKERQAMMGKLKNYITESEQSIEGKGVDIYVTEVYSNFIIFSNIIDALYIEEESRRFFVHVNHSPPQSEEYYQKIADWLESETGIPSLYTWLMNRDISAFRPVGYAPHTASKKEVILANTSETEIQIMEDIENENSIFASDIITNDGWHFYVNNVLHKGAKMSVAHEKHVKSRLFKSVRYLGGDMKAKSSRQVQLVSIGPASDSDVIMRGNSSKKTSIMTCRNHHKYDAASINEIKAEYEKIFVDKPDSNVSLIK